MNNKFTYTGKCIWCGKTEPIVTFDTAPHIIPKSLSACEIGFDVCDECNHYFGTATQGMPSCDLCFKEIFNSFWIFGHNLNKHTYKQLKSTFFSYFHKTQSIKIRGTFNSRNITRQFKRSLYEIFLQKYHEVTKNGNHPMFDMVRKFARYNIGNPHVYYAFNNVILAPNAEDRLFLNMNQKAIDNMLESGLFCFWFSGHVFYIEVLPTVFNVNGLSYLRKEAKTMLIPAIGNESIFEFTDIMQIDFLMQRFNS